MRITTEPFIFKENINKWLLLFLILNVYTEVPLDLGNTVLPAFPYVGSIPFLIIWLRKRITRVDWMLMFKLVVILIASMLFSVGLGDLVEKIIGAFQISVSVIGGVILLKIITLVSQKTFENILLCCWVLLFVGGVLEILGITKEGSDIFREWAYSKGGYGNYANDARDLEMIGFLRPKFFSSEPSLLAIGFMSFINGWLVLQLSQKRIFIVVLFSFMAIYVIGSPVIYISIFLSLLFYFGWSRNKSHYFGLIIGMIILFGYIFITPDNIIKKRFNVENLGEDVGFNRSENVRLYLPYMTAIEVLKLSPLFGVGISGKEATPEIANSPLEPVYLVSNNVAAIFIYLGIVGAVSFVYVLNGYLRLYGISRTWFIFFYAFCLGNSMGGFESPRFWGYIFLFTGYIYHAENRKLKHFLG